MNINKNNKELLELVKNNPDLPIITATHYDVCCEDHGYWIGEIIKIKVDYYYICDEQWCAGEDEIKEQFIFELENDENLPELSVEDFDKTIDDRFDMYIKEGKIKEAIIIFIGI